ncbi:lysine-rich coiled-coil protein 1 isoform X2 [Alligator mississippiensis]|uniref:lysine-rich coiled-coil protein 1 isoform X2 n=1 Tax=Alligator mississippiensis TaxID=8496 RepID=UPI0028776464|nr:lysine-rich coiled-coil protein 1 isoform X2 [Alligator mississippiensis]
MVLIHVGTNDVARSSPDHIMSVYRALGTRLRKTGAQVVFFLILLVNGHSRRHITCVNEVNPQLWSWCHCAGFGFLDHDLHFRTGDLLRCNGLHRSTKDGTLDEATRKDLFTDTFCKVCGAVLQFESQRISHYVGKKHAQKVRLYFQVHGKQDEGQKAGKQKKTDYINFQMDESGVVDKNKYCSLCNMIFTSPVVAQSHYVGKIHAKKLRQLSGDQAQMLAQSIQPETASSPTGASALPAPQQPSAEKSSQDIETEESASSSSMTLDLNDPDKFCKLCSAPFNNPLVAHQHYVGKKHKRNELRKKMMKDLGDEAVPAESSANVGVGNYICPICNITLTSIEMYQSHMQGNKHQIKETMVVNLIKNSKKTYDSFQDELADYIKVQKARGLEPKTYFRKPEEDEFKTSEFEENNDHDDTVPLDAKFERDEYCSPFSETWTSSYAVENRLPCWSPAYQTRLRLENTLTCHYSKDRYLEMTSSQVTAYRGNSYGPESKESGDCYDHISSDTSTSSHKKEQKVQRKQDEEEHHFGKEVKHEKEPAKQKRKENNEDPDSGKESEKQKRRKVDTDSAIEKKSKHSKDKRLKEIVTEKESRKHKKDKKKPQIDGKTDEEILWDESILGY